MIPQALFDAITDYRNCAIRRQIERDESRAELRKIRLEHAAAFSRLSDERDAAIEAEQASKGTVAKLQRELAKCRRQAKAATAEREVEWGFAHKTHYAVVCGQVVMVWKVTQHYSYSIGEGNRIDTCVSKLESAKAAAVAAAMHAATNSTRT